LDWDQALKKSVEFIPHIEAYDHEIMEEIRGIAEGAGCLLEEILAINIRSELLFLLETQGNAIQISCTSIAATPDATKSQETLLAQNWDWYAQAGEHCIILSIKQTGKPDIIQVGEAGLIAKMGMNSAGIGMCTNALVCDNWRVSVPFHVILRGILNASTMTAAVGAVSKAVRASAGDFLIGHVDGMVLNIETAPETFNILVPELGTIAHTNHFLIDNPKIKDFIPSMWPDSIVRKHRASMLLASECKLIELSTIKKVLRDHFDYPHSICAHGDGIAPESQTGASVIINLSKRQFHVAKGHPCKHSYYCFDLTSNVNEISH